MSRQSADRRVAVVRKWVAMLVLAVSVGTVWGVIVGIVGTIGNALLPSEGRTIENIVVAADGTPLVQTYIGGNYQNAELRTLEGQSIELAEESWLGASGFAEPYREPGVLRMPITWGERIAGCSDAGKPPANWLLMRDNRRPGSAYFVGYDTVSKSKLGYIGREGLRPTIPPADEQFDLGDQTLSWGSNVLATVLYINYGGSGNHYYTAAKSEDGRHLAPWIVFLCDGEVVRRIDLRDHSVRPLAEIENLVAIGVAGQPVSNAERSDEETSEPEPPGEQSSRGRSGFQLTSMQTLQLFAASPVDTKRKTVHRLLARCTDRIVAINPFDGTQREFLLPEELRQRSLTIYSVADDRLLIQTTSGYWEQGSVAELLWTNPEGKITRQVTQRLAGYVPPEPGKQVFGIAAIVPSLLPWAIGSTIVAPLAMEQSHQVDDYMAGLRKSIAECWPVLLLILGISIVLSLIVRRWQIKYCRDNTWLWSATVFATTVPGLLAYWLMHRTSVLTPCGECGKMAPRDRDGCAHCDKPFAAPAILGTEILV